MTPLYWITKTHSAGKEERIWLGIGSCSSCSALFGLLFLAYMTNADMKLIEKIYNALIAYHDAKDVEEKI